MSNPSIDRSFDFPADVPEPGLATRVWRFGNVVWLAVYVYAGYKATQLWTRLVSDRNKAELYRRQDLRAARALYRTVNPAGRFAHQGMPVHRDARRRAARRMGIDALGAA